MRFLLLFLLVTVSPFVSSQTKKKSKSPIKNTKFNIQIQGIIFEDCAKPLEVAFGEYHGSDAEVEKVKPNAKGEFISTYWMKEPGLFFYRIGGSTQYFLITPKEKIYKLGLSCNKRDLEPITVFSSAENKAYQEFVELNKLLTSEFENYRGKNLNDTLIYKEFREKIKDYQKKSAGLAKKYLNSYVAGRLLPADRIGEADLATIEKLRQTYLKKAVFGDEKFYNTKLPSILLENYLEFIVDKKDNSFAAIEWVLNTASKNPTAAKRLQDMLYQAINKSKRQDLMRGYIQWSMDNPDKMVNEVAKFKLDRLSKSMVDAQFINITLKDTTGVDQELRNVVIKSKYTLLMIYNPDCSHCIETLPKLIPVGERYQSKGLGLFSVAAKNDHNLWINFIKKYTGKGWTNVMEDQTNSSFGKYSINSLPSFVLIDAKGKIVSRMVADNVMTELQKWLDLL